MTATATTQDPLYLQIEQQPDLLAELNAQPARVTINGKRHYNTPFYTGPVPSVTTIISETASEANKKKLDPNNASKISGYYVACCDLSKLWTHF